MSTLSRSVPIISTIILTTGVHKFKAQNDPFELLSPVHSKFTLDRRRIFDFYKMSDSLYPYLSISAKNKNDNLLADQLRLYVGDMIDYMSQNISIVDVDGRVYTYRMLENKESPYYATNALFEILFQDRSAVPLYRFGQLHYPIAKAISNSFLPLPVQFGGVGLSEKNNVQSIRSVLIKFSIIANTTDSYRRARLFEHKLANYLQQFENDPKSPVNAALQTWPYLMEEIQQNTVLTLRLIPISLTLVFIFTCLACTTLNYETSCTTHAFCGLISVIMSFFSAFGFVFWIGVEYNDLMALSAFLALAIGVDDSFILINAWKHHLLVKSKNQEERLIFVLRNAGASITFTSLTDVLAFGVGCYFEITLVRNFCLLNTVAIAFDWIYQVTFFPAAMLLCERIRNKQKSIYIALMKMFSWLTCSRPIIAPSMVTLSVKRLFKPSALTMEQQENGSQSSFEPIYQDFSKLTRCILWVIFSKLAQFLMLTVIIFLLVLAILFGMSKAQLGASWQKLITKQSPLYSHVDSFDRDFWQQAVTLTVLADSPDPHNKTDVDHFMTFAQQLTQLNQSMGEHSDILFLHDVTTNAIEDFFGDTLVTNDDYMDNMQIVLDDAANLPYLSPNGNRMKLYHRSNFIELDKDGLPLRFTYPVCFLGLTAWTDRIDWLNEIKTLSDKYPEYNLSFFTEVIVPTDLLAYMHNAMVMSQGQVLLVTAGIVFLFTASTLHTSNLCLFFCTCTLFMIINMTVCGLLLAWNCDVDPITMVTVLMSVGFSVDYIVHMSHHLARYNHGANEDLKLHIGHSLEAVAWPIIQSAISTLLAIAPIVFINSYMVNAFLKTVLLVITLGVMHALIVLPMIFVLICYCPLESRHRRLKGGCQQMPTRKVNFTIEAPPPGAFSDSQSSNVVEGPLSTYHSTY